MTQFAFCQDKKVAYSSFGSGFPLVFVHGFCENRQMWNEFIKPFSKKYRILTIDIGGFGESDLPKEDSIQYMAAQVNAVLEQENIETCILIGHSMGGYTALAFAKQFGDKLKGLCMFHTHPFGDTPEKKKNRDKAIRFVKEHGSKKFVTSMIPILFSSHYRVEFKQLVQDIIYASRDVSNETVISGLKAMRDRPNNAAVLENIQCPVQFIIGKQDSSVTWEQSLKQSSLPKIADIRIFDEVGHMGMYEATTKTQTALQSFVEFCINRI